MNSSDRFPEGPDDELRILQQEVTRKQYYQRNPQRIAESLSGLMARRGYAQEHSTLERDKAWQKAAGAALAKHSRPAKLRRGILEVTVASSAVMQELTFRKKKLLKTLLEALPDLKIRDLRFRVGALEQDG
jgi:predicted nucleic acid-binding Zn ribbon protein